MAGQYNRVILSKPRERLITCNLCRTAGQRSHQQTNTFGCQKAPFKILKQQYPRTWKNCPLLEQSNGKTRGPFSFLSEQKQQYLQPASALSSAHLKGLKRTGWKEVVRRLTLPWRKVIWFSNTIPSLPWVISFSSSSPNIIWVRSTHTKNRGQRMYQWGHLRKSCQLGVGGVASDDCGLRSASRRHYWGSDKGFWTPQ